MKSMRFGGRPNCTNTFGSARSAAPANDGTEPPQNSSSADQSLWQFSERQS